jgi:hypothetical protein
MDEIKHRIRDVIDDVRTGELDRGIGAVVFQGYNTLLRAVEVERKIKETQEFDERLEALETRISGYAAS